MRKIILDTDILVDFFHNQKYAQALLARVIKKDSLNISVLTIAELRAGFSDKQAQFFLPKLYNMVRVLPVSENIAELGGEFRFTYRRRGISLSAVDTLIAATAIVENCWLVTRNKKDYPMPQLKLYPIDD